FVMTLPSGFSILSLLVVRHENSLVAVPAKYVESQEELQSGSFSSGENGELRWNDLPVFNPEGQLFFTGSIPVQKEGIILSYLKRRIVLIVDEVLFKKEVAEESITLYIAGSPHLHKMSLYNAESELYYLSPSIAVT
ncbi:MAG: chemotaxis protein CheA, partial [Spirochaetota bacterium]